MSFVQKIRPGPRLIDPFRNEFVFYGEGLLAPSPTPKLEDHPLSFVQGCLFNMQKSSQFLLEIMMLVSSANIMGIAKVFIVGGRSFI
jgi:hypothetical protein